MLLCICYKILFYFFRNRRDPVFFGDFKESDLRLPERRTKFWKIANETVSKYKKMNKYYQCKIKRLKEKIRNLNVLIDELTKNQKLSSEQSFILKVS